MSDCALSDDALYRLLADDVPAGDLTTETLGIGAAPARVEFRARGAMRACGTEEARRLFELAGAACCEVRVGSGTPVEAGVLLLSAEGAAGALHRAWKTAQNLVEWMSGIATAAAAIVHRLGLSETLLVFAEHRLFIDAEPGATVRRLRALQPEKRAVIEVGDADEALAWAEAGAEILQLEKFPPDCVAALRESLQVAGLAPLLVATGGVGVHNAAAYASSGADMIATSAPYTAPPADVAVRFECAGKGGHHA